MSNVYVKTYGCSFNHLDSEIMQGKLKEANFNIVDTPGESDLILINSCTVKNLSESKFFNDVRKYLEQSKKLMVSGCITQAEESYLSSRLKGVSVIGTNDLDKVAFVASQTLLDNPIQIISRLKSRGENEEVRLEKEKLRLASEKKRKNPNIEIIPINEGCLNTCSFCKTKQARGHLFSYSIESIKKSMERAVSSGTNEIYLTSQDTGCYGFDIGTNLPNLLRELLTIEGDYRIRIGMGNPNHFKEIIDEILDIMLSDKRVYKFLHIPLQSGSDRILDEMRRMYCHKDFKEILVKAKLKIPDITIANDVIVAYPTETIDEFKQTLSALRGTNVLNFSRFWLRPNTPAQRMYSGKDFIDGRESKRRAKIVRNEFIKLAFGYNEKWVGWEGEVLISEKGKAETLVARNDYYKPIIIENEDSKLKIGERVRVRIRNVTWYHFEGVCV